MKTISLILMIAVGLLSIAGCSRESLNMNEATATHQETIALEGGSPVVLDVRSGVGEVIVHGAETDSIHVEYKLTAYGKTQADADIVKPITSAVVGWPGSGTSSLFAAALTSTDFGATAATDSWR